MANTSFKVENGLLVQGNAQFDYTSKFNANVTVAADQFYIGGNLYVTGAQVFIGGNAAVADILAGASGLSIGNTTHQFSAHLSNVFVYGTHLNPVGNTVLLGNSTNRWVISGNTLNISTTSTLTGAATLANTIAVTGAATLANTLGITGATTLSNTMSVTGAANALSTFGVGGAANALSTFGVTGAANALSTLGISGAANALSTFGVTGVATFANTTSHIGAATFSNTLAVTGTTTLTGNATLSGALQTISGNAAFNSSTLFVDATNNRVGIGTTGPATTLTIQGTFNANGAATLSNTSAHTGSATFANTIAVTGAATLANTLAVTGTTTFNNDVTINANLTVTGTRTYVNTQTLDISDNIITLNADLPGASPPTENAGLEINRGSSANSRLQWNETTDTWQITADGTNFFNILSEGTSNTSFDSGTLFVDAVNNRVGINNTAPGVALRVTGAVDISSTANVQGNANVGGTLGVNGLLFAAGNANIAGQTNTATLYVTTSANVGTVFTVNTTITNSAANVQLTTNATAGFVGIGITPTSTTKLFVNSQFAIDSSTFGIQNRYIVANTSITTPRGYYGIVNQAENVSLNSDGVTTYASDMYSFVNYAYNGPGNAQIGQMYGATIDARNYANGTLGNTVTIGVGTRSAYYSFGSGVTTTAYGVQAAVAAGNNAITGNIGTAYGVTSTIASNTSMTIGTGYLFVGQFNGATTTNKFGVYISGESNNYFSSNVSIAGGLLVSTNSSFDSGTLFVDAVNNRVGINNTAPGVALRVTGAVDISSTANVQGNANVSGLLGVAGGLAVTGTTNTSAQFNVGGGVATTNGATITNTSILLGNSSVNTQISPSQIIIRTNATGNAYSQLLLASSDQIGGSLALQHGNTTSNSTIVLGSQSGNNATIELGGSSAAFIDFKTPSEDDFDTRLISSTSGFSIIAGSSTSANIVNITSANVNIDSGTLFVDAVNNRVGINNTAPGVALRVTGVVDISSTANVQGNANVGGTLGVASLLTASGGLAVTGIANVSSNLNVTGAANALSTFGVNGLLTACSGLIVTGTANVSTDLNVSGTANVSNNLQVIGQIQLGTYGTTNGVLISNTGLSMGNVTHFTTQTRSQFVITAGTGVRANLTSTALFVGNTTSNAIVSGNLISISNTANLTSTTLTIGATTVNNSQVNSALHTAGLFGVTNGATINATSIRIGNTTSNAIVSGNLISVSNTANLTSTTLTIGTTTVTTALINTAAINVVNQTNTATLFVTTSANVGTALTINSTALAVTPNANFDSGVLFVDALNNRVGINNTAPGVALRVTGAVDISSTANIQSNANVGGTLGVSGVATLSSNTFIGKTAADGGVTAGIELRSSGTGFFTRAAETAAFFNRLTDDGTIVAFQQAGTTEGAISIAGTTTTYGAFCGAHWSQLSDNSRPNILKGTVVETIDEMCEWQNEDNDQLPKFKISDTVASKSVYGVFQTWDNDDDVNNDANIASLGAYIIRVDAGVTVSKGDLLESAGNGCARVQSDDIIRSSTIGKVTNGSHVIETYEDGSYLVPCVLYCG